MYQTFEQIDVDNMTLEQFKVLAKDENVYLMYNVYNVLDDLYKKHNLEEPIPEDCWRLKPLKKICSTDEKLLDFYAKRIGECRYVNNCFQSFVRIVP